jgi:hypothetical protein
LRPFHHNYWKIFERPRWSLDNRLSTCPKKENLNPSQLRFNITRPACRNVEKAFITRADVSDLREEVRASEKRWRIFIRYWHHLEMIRQQSYINVKYNAWISINTWLIYILWHENYHISLVATAMCALMKYLFSYRSMKINHIRIYRKKLEYPLCITAVSLLKTVPNDTCKSDKRSRIK